MSNRKEATHDTKGYPQMPALTDEETESFLKQPNIARLCTTNEDGTIHVAPVWYRFDNGEILIGTQDVSRKVRNIRRNNRVTVEIDTNEWPFKGIMIYGKAELDYEDVAPKRVAINTVYMPQEQAVAFVKSVESQWKQVVIRVRPDRSLSYDYSKG